MVIRMQDDNLDQEQVEAQAFKATQFGKEHFELADHVRIIQWRNK
jgi:hypothetical protein